MLGPHIFGGWPVTSRISATSSRQSFRFCALSMLPMKAAGLTLVGVVLMSAIVRPGFRDWRPETPANSRSLRAAPIDRSKEYTNRIERPTRWQAGREPVVSTPKSSLANPTQRRYHQAMKSMRQLTAIIEREDDQYVALCPELDIASQGQTVEAARNNLIEALELFFESADPTEVARRLHSEVFVTRVEVAVG